MQETLTEYCDSRGVGVRVDREAGVIRGVKILGLTSRNGRCYAPEALAQAAALYENAKVNVNHPRGAPQAPRDYQDRIGAIRAVALKPGEGLFADFHFNPKHALAEQLAWDAEHAPENVGFSHNVEARTARRDGRTVVEAIVRVASVDLVADPATTRGLFEAAAAAPAALTLESLRSERPELVAALLEEQAAEHARLEAEIERLREAERRAARRAAIVRLLARCGLPQAEATDARSRVLVSPAFVEALLAAPSEDELAQLIEDRAALVRALSETAAGHAAKPLARDQHEVERLAPTDARAFAAVLRRE